MNGIAIKGDIPIGVTRCSSDVWAEPHLFKLDRNCGAPGQWSALLALSVESASNEGSAQRLWSER
eukprot:2281815-Rhodomonas_salina.2